jgi:flagellar biosynthesis/type III secretory pathway protein FliH
MDKMKELESDSNLLSVAEIQDIYEQSYDRGLYKAEQEGMKRGEELGAEKTLVSTIKSMLQNKLGYELISKVTGKNQDEIRKIEQSMNLG